MAGGTAGADVRWVVADQLGTPRMVVDRTGSLAGVTRHNYLPFGEELSAGVGGRETTPGYNRGDNVRQQFTGYERDGETGLNFAGARYYASSQGRFTGCDPFDPVLGRQGAEDKEEANKQFIGYLSQPQHWNRYTYSLNNPLKYTDPDGMDPTLTVKLNIIFDRSSNYSDEEKKAFVNTYVAQAQQDFGKVDVKFEITYEDGTASNVSNSRREMTSGVHGGSINAFVTRDSVGLAPEVTTESKGEVWISTGQRMDSQSPGNLTHGIIHALGIAPGVNGYDVVDHSGTRYDIIRREVWNALTGNSAESATQSLQDHLRTQSECNCKCDYNKSAYRNEVRILRQGAEKYLKR